MPFFILYLALICFADLPFLSFPFLTLPYLTLLCLAFASLERVVTKPIRFIADAADLTTFKGYDSPPHFEKEMQTITFLTTTSS